MGLMISSCVKTEQLASQLSPYSMIAQLLFLCVLFEMKVAASGVSAMMLSRWGMAPTGKIGGFLRGSLVGRECVAVSGFPGRKVVHFVRLKG